MTVTTNVQDLNGTALAQADSEEFTYTGDDLTIRTEKTPGEEPESYIGNSCLFQGREWDTDTGLYYYRARYLHPELGRFLQGDSKGYADSMNLYQAFGQNGVNFVDPMGTMVTLPLSGITGFVRSSYFQERYHTTRALWGEVQTSVKPFSGEYHEDLYTAIAWTIKTRARIKKKTMAEMASQPFQYQGYEDVSKKGFWDPKKMMKERNQRYFRKMWQVVDEVILGARTDPTEGATHFYSRREARKIGDREFYHEERLKVPYWAVDWVRTVNGKQVVSEFRFNDKNTGVDKEKVEYYLHFEKETTLWEVTPYVPRFEDLFPIEIPIISRLLNKLFALPSTTLTSSKLIEKKTSWEIPSKFAKYIVNWRFYKNIKF